MNVIKVILFLNLSLSAQKCPDKYTWTVTDGCQIVDTNWIVLPIVPPGTSTTQVGNVLQRLVLVVRAIKSLEDVQISLRELFSFKELLETKDQDLQKRRIRNASPAILPNDYVILSQLPTVPTIPPEKKQHYTIVFNPPSTVGTTISPPFIINRDRAGKPIQCQIAVGVLGTGDFVCNFQRNGANLFTQDITIPAGQSGPVYSSLFVTTFPKFGLGDLITPTITSVGGVSLITMQILVERIVQDVTIP